MIGIKVQGLAQVTRKFAELPADLQAARLRGVQIATMEMRNRLFLAMSAVAVPVPFWGVRSPTGPVLAARSGHTRSALTPGNVWVAGGVVFGAVGHDEPHVAALEVGATITPKNGQYLRIPTVNALTASGVDRYMGMSIRSIPDARLIRTKAGKLWAVRDVGKGRTARVEFLFLLVRSVKLPEKRVFGTVADTMNAIAPKIVETQVVTAVTDRR